MNSELQHITNFVFYYFNEHGSIENWNSDVFTSDSFKYSEWNIISRFLSRTKRKTHTQLAKEMHLLKNFLMSLRQRNKMRKLGHFTLTVKVSKMTPKFT